MITAGQLRSERSRIETLILRFEREAESLRRKIDDFRMDLDEVNKRLSQTQNIKLTATVANTPT